jgi:methionyl-tRNA formyltransferase
MDKKVWARCDFCLGWSNLLKAEILKAAPLGVIGFHPAALPANRGRHPLIWALGLGLDETATTFFFMDKGADRGISFLSCAFISMQMTTQEHFTKK